MATERAFKVFDTEQIQQFIEIDIFPDGDSFITIENPDTESAMTIKLDPEDLQWLVDNVTHELARVKK